MKIRLILATTVFTLLFASAAFGQANLKVIAFYPKFCETTTGSPYYAIEPNDMNWRGTARVVHFTNGKVQLVAQHFSCSGGSPDVFPDDCAPDD